jgi:hypothetical protein
MRSSIIRTVCHVYYWNGQIKEDEMGRTCSMHWVDEKCTQNIGKPEGESHLEVSGQMGLILYLLTLSLRIKFSLKALECGFNLH